jgi:hypothetical protein
LLLMLGEGCTSQAASKVWSVFKCYKVTVLVIYRRTINVAP